MPVHSYQCVIPQNARHIAVETWQMIRTTGLRMSLDGQTWEDIVPDPDRTGYLAYPSGQPHEMPNASMSLLGLRRRLDRILPSSILYRGENTTTRTLTISEDIDLLPPDIHKVSQQCPPKHAEQLLSLIAGYEQRQLRVSLNLAGIDYDTPNPARRVTPRWTGVRISDTAWHDDENRRLWVGYFKLQHWTNEWSITRILFWARRPRIALTAVVRSGHDPREFHFAILN